MELDLGSFDNWVWDMPSQLASTKKKILRDGSLFSGSQGSAWSDLQSLYVLCVLSGEKIAADDLLRSVFAAWPASEEHKLPSTCSEVELIWYHSNSRPKDIPWESSSTQLAVEERIKDVVKDATKPEYGIEDPKFFSEWVSTSWIDDVLSRGPISGCETLKASYDPHEWRDSSDALTHAICAQLLCQTPDGAVPDRKAITEAFEAVERLFTVIPHRSENGVTLPHMFIFSPHVYFLLAFGLGKREAARKALRVAASKSEWSLAKSWVTSTKMLTMSAVYEVLFDETVTEGKITAPLPPDKAREAILALKAAVEAKTGRDTPGDEFSQMHWPELLRRFSQAVYKQLKKDEEENGGDGDEDDEDDEDDEEKREETAGIPRSPLDVLLPPLTAQEIADVERQLGPIPHDIKEMSRVARGFKGGWHFASGGFPGIQTLEPDSADEHSEFLDGLEDSKPSAITQIEENGKPVTVTEYHVSLGGKRKRDDSADNQCWTCEGTVRNDDFIQVIFPPATWKKLKKGEVKNGDYCICSYSHWTDGVVQEEQHKSMRDWIVHLTQSAESELSH